MITYKEYFLLFFNSLEKLSIPLNSLFILVQEHAMKPTASRAKRNNNNFHFNRIYKNTPISIHIR